MTPADRLRSYGFAGAFMVAEPYPEGHGQSDAATPDDPASHARFCVVGDDLDALVETTFQAFDLDRSPHA